MVIESLASVLVVCVIQLMTFDLLPGHVTASPKQTTGAAAEKPVHATKTRSLYIGGIFPMAGSWAGGRGCRPAVDIALQDVNSRRDILPGYKLEMLANDSECKPGLGMNVLYELLYKDPVKLMLLGPGCSAVSTFVGQAARMWNLVVLSYGSSSPALASRKRFPTFFRTHPSATIHNPARIKLFKKFGWTRIATIQDTQEVFTSTMEDLEERAKNSGIEIAVRTNFLMDPANAVRNLKRQDARVIVGLFYEDKARRVFCEVYKQKLYGPRYVWFIIGWYADNWYMERDTNCTVDQMKEAIEGHITTEGLMLNSERNMTTVSGMTVSEVLNQIEHEIRNRLGEQVNPLSVTGYVEAPLAYDAAWALALALDKAQKRLLLKNLSLEQFDYSNRAIMEEIYTAMNSTDFIGVSGRVAFNSEGDRIALTQIEQMTDGNYTKLGFYDIGSENLDWFDAERWPGDKRPQDRTIVEKKLRVISTGLLIVMYLLASVGIVASISLLVFNCLYRHRRVIRMSQPQVNSVMLFGCIICFTCVYLNGLDGQYVHENRFSHLCQIRGWLLCVGFTFAYGSLFSKVWTIYRLTTRRKKDLKVISEWEMYVVVVVCLMVDVAVMLTWQVVDPLRRDLEDFAHEKSGSSDVDTELLPQLEHCVSDNLNIWFGVVFGYKGVLLLFGILLAYETRNIKVKHVNDSRFVGMSIYNVVVLCLITVPVTLIIGSHQDASFAFVSVAILLSSFLSMSLIFVPKILDILQNVDETAAAAADSVACRVEDEHHRRLLQENDELKAQIIEKEERIVELKKQLQMKLDGTEPPPPSTTAPTSNPPPPLPLPPPASSAPDKRRPSRCLVFNNLSTSQQQQQSQPKTDPSGSQRRSDAGAFPDQAVRCPSTRTPSVDNVQTAVSFFSSESHDPIDDDDDEDGGRRDEVIQYDNQRCCPKTASASVVTTTTRTA